MQVIINQKIKTEVYFSNSNIFIKWFIWDLKKIQVKKITHRWWTKEGESKILHFAVLGDGGYYEISYNLETFDWILEKVDVE